MSDQQAFPGVPVSVQDVLTRQLQNALRSGAGGVRVHVVALSDNWRSNNGIGGGERTVFAAGGNCIVVWGHTGYSSPGVFCHSQLMVNGSPLGDYLSFFHNLDGVHMWHGVRAHPLGVMGGPFTIGHRDVPGGFHSYDTNDRTMMFVLELFTAG